MDNFDSSNSGNRNADKPIPFDDDDTSEPNVSHSPLDLGGSGGMGAPKVTTSAAEVVKPTAKKPAEKIVSTDRITGVKTFFAKLHAGSLDFVAEQIVNWLKENPGITVKRTNTTVGNVVGKTTEANIIITVWY